MLRWVAFAGALAALSFPSLAQARTASEASAECDAHLPTIAPSTAWTYHCEYQAPGTVAPRYNVIATSVHDGSTQSNFAFWIIDEPCPPGTSLVGGLCIICGSDDDCDDSLFCNGLELCNGATGECEPGTPPDCSDPDGLMCTPGLCEEPMGCIDGPPDESMCVCDPPPNPNREVTLPELELGLSSLPCPIVSGSAGASLKVTGMYTHQSPDCSNSCTTADNASLSATVGMSFCSPSRGLSVGLAGNYSRREQGCAVCAEGSCEQTCGASSCLTETTGGAATASISRALGFSLGPKRIFGSRWQVFCGATVTGTVNLSGSQAATSGSLDCGDCNACTATTLSSGISGGAKASCRVVGGLFGHRINLGLQDLGSIDVAYNGARTGGCGSPCTSQSITVRGAVRIPLSARGTRWWGLRGSRELACTGMLSGCVEQNSCGTCAACPDCADGTASLSCGVLPAESAD